MTRETIGRLPVHIAERIESFRLMYKNPAYNKDETRARLGGYTQGLKDAGLITERERQIIFVYGTV